MGLQSHDMVKFPVKIWIWIRRSAKYFSNGLESLGHWETLNCPVKNIFLNKLLLSVAGSSCEMFRAKKKNKRQLNVRFFWFPRLNVEDDECCVWGMIYGPGSTLLGCSHIHHFMCNVNLFKPLEKRRSRRHSITKKKSGSQARSNIQTIPEVLTCRRIRRPIFWILVPFEGL